MQPGDPDDETSFTGSLSDVDDDESVEDTLARQQRWDDLVARLVERAEAATEPSDRVQSLVRAALVYEAKLDDPEKSFLILQAAFQEDFTNEEVAHELARVTTAAGKWGVLVQDCEELMPRLPNDRKRVDLLLALAHFYEAYLRDLVAAEQILGGAVALDPHDITALRGLATLAARRGDWARAVEYLANAAESSRHPLERVRLHLEAASIFETQLADFTRAARQFQKVLGLSRGNPIAVEALARLAPELGEKSIELEFTPEPVLPVLEPVGASEHPPAPADPTPPPTVRRAPQPSAPPARRSARGEDRGDVTPPARPSVSVPVLAPPPAARPLPPAPAPAPAPPRDPADVALDSARTALARGDAATAVETLARALQTRPEHRGCRVALIAANTALGDLAAAAHHRSALLGLVDDADDRFDLLVETGRSLRDDQKDAAGALRTLREALELRPDDHGTLHDVLELLTKSKQWKSAVQVLGKLASLETGTARARYLVATGNILNYELHALDEAVDLYNQALDEDAEDLKTFERIEKILSAKRAWRDEARNFRRMIKRLGVNPPPTKRPLALMLWKGLGEICRTRLKDYAAAVTAFEVCASLDPADGTYHEILAEIFERQGPSAAQQALEKRAMLLEKARDREDMIRHIRAMLQIHLDGKQHDRIWCACAALVALGAADPQERGWYEQLTGRPLPRPRGALSEEMWQRAVYHPREDRRLSRLFGAVSPTMTLMRAKEARGFGLDERRRAPAGDASLLSQLVTYVCALLGVGRPSLYVEPKRSGLELMNVLDQARLIPALVVGGDLTRPRPDRELAFLLGRTLAMLRFEHMVLWPQVLSSPAELRTLCLAVLKLFHPPLEVPGPDAGALQKFAGQLRRTLPPQVLEPLMSVVPELAAEAATVDVSGWATAAHLTANRAGLVVCGDLLVAIRVVSEDAGTRGVAGEEAVADLVRWSVSPEHLAVREQLGLAMELAGPAPAFAAARATAGARVVDEPRRGR